VEDVKVAVKQNLTVQLDRETVRKAKILAAQRGTSISGLVAAQIRDVVSSNDAYEAARRTALELLQQGFHLGGGRVNRDALHER
jgi:hypothetical protein